MTTDAQGQPGNDASAPTPRELSESIARLLDEVAAAFTGDRWAILDSGTDRVLWLFYDGAALRHCCRLVHEMEVAAQSEQEFAVRLLARAHLEAWLVGLYIHYGGSDALARVAQDTVYNLEAAQNDATEFDKWLAGEKKAARESARKVEEANKGIQRWNKANPQLPPKPLLVADHLPQLRPTGLDLSDRIAVFDNLEGKPLPVSELVDILTKLAVEKDFGKESFRPLYLIYRILSSISAHPTLNIFDSYFIPGNFIRIAPTPINGSTIDNARITAIHATAFLTCAVLGEQGCDISVAEDLRSRFAPDPSGRSAWAPGV